MLKPNEFSNTCPNCGNTLAREVETKMCLHLNGYENPNASHNSAFLVAVETFCPECDLTFIQDAHINIDVSPITECPK